MHIDIQGGVFVMVCGDQTEILKELLRKKALSPPKPYTNEFSVALVDLMELMKHTRDEAPLA